MGAASVDLTVIASCSHRDTGRWFGSTGTSAGFSGCAGDVLFGGDFGEISGLQGAQARRSARVGEGMEISGSNSLRRTRGAGGFGGGAGEAGIPAAARAELAGEGCRGRKGTIWGRAGRRRRASRAGAW